MFIYKNIITIEPGKRSGKPCIRNMRITTDDILRMLAAEMSEEEVLIAVEFSGNDAFTTFRCYPDFSYFWKKK